MESPEDPFKRKKPSGADFRKKRQKQKKQAEAMGKSMRNWLVPAIENRALELDRPLDNPVEDFCQEKDQNDPDDEGEEGHHEQIQAGQLEVIQHLRKNEILLSDEEQVSAIESMGRGI